MEIEEKIWEELKTVYDPEIGLNVVDLGLIYGVEIEGSRVSIRMTVTTPGCPLQVAMEQWVKEAVMRVPGVEEVEVQVVFDPPWTPERMSGEARAMLGYGF